MPSSRTKRVLIGIAIALAILIILAGITGAIYLHRVAQPLAGPVTGSAPDVFSLIPADAPVVAYFDAKALKTTQNSALQTIGAIALPSPNQDPDYTEFVKNTGFDYARDLDRAAIAIWPFDAANSNDNGPTLAIADGRFDEERIKAYALKTGHTTSVNGETIYEIPGDPPISFEFLSASRVELASGPKATAMLTNHSAGHRDPAMQSRIQRVAGAPLFAAARTDNLPTSFYANFKNAPQLLRYVKTVQALTLAGQPQGDDLALTIDGECKSFADAQQLGVVLGGMRLLGAVALSDPKTRGQMTPQQAALFSALLAKVQIAPQDNYVRLTLALTPQMLSAK